MKQRLCCLVVIISAFIGLLRRRVAVDCVKSDKQDAKANKSVDEQHVIRVD